MGTFSNLVFLRDKAKAFAKTASTGPLSTTLQALNRFKVYLEQSTGKMTNMLSGFLTDSSLMADQIVDNTFYSVDHPPIAKSFDGTAFSLLRQALYEVSDNGNLIITDANGRVFSLQVASSMSAPYIIYNNYYNVVNQKTVFKNLYEALRILDMGHPVVPTDDIDYVVDAIAEELEITLTSTTLLDKMNEILDADYETLLEAAKAILMMVANANEDRLETSHIHSGAVIMSHSQMDGYELNNMIFDMYGRAAIIWDVINDLIESNSLNDMLLEYCRLAGSGVTELSQYNAVYNEYATSKFSSVRDGARMIRDAMQTNGIYGLAKAVLSFSESAHSATNEDGLMTFTDNSLYTPRVYLSGLLSGVISSVTQFVSLIVLAFGKILGVAINILGELISSFVQKIDVDFSSSRCAIVDSNKVQIDAAPIAGIQGEFDIEDAPQSIYLDLFAAGYTTGAFHVPGGYIVFGPGSFNDDGEVASVRYEFHPSFTKLNGHSFVDNDVSVDFGSTSPGGVRQDYATLTFHLQASQSDPTKMVGSSIADALYESFAECSEVSVFDNDIDGVTTEEKDFEMRKYIFINSLIFQVWCLATTHSDTLFSMGGPQIKLGHYRRVGEEDYLFLKFDDYLLEYCPVNNVAFTRSLENAILSGLSVIYLYLHDDIITTIVSPDIGRVHFFGANNLDYDSVIHIYEVIPVWANIVASLTKFSTANINYMITYLPVFGDYVGTADNSYYDQLIPFSGEMEWAIKMPEYDSSSFWKWVILTAVVTAVTVVGVVVTSFLVKKAIRKRQAINQAKVYQAYDEFQKNPDADHYKAYRKVAFKNNMFASLTGGTKYDKLSVWSDTSSSSDNSSVASSLVQKAKETMLNDTDYVNDSLNDPSQFDKLSKENADGIKHSDEQFADVKTDIGTLADRITLLDNAFLDLLSRVRDIGDGLNNLKVLITGNTNS